MRVTLESFEEDGAPSVEESSDYKRGFAAGLLEGEASNAVSLGQSLASISSTLTDMSFGFEEARIHVLEGLRPLLAQLAETILPQIAQDAFGAHLAEAVESALKTASDAPIIIAVSPDALPALADSAPNKQFDFKADPSLGAGQALIAQGNTHVLLDLAALTTELQAVLNGLEHSERTHSHG